MPKRANPPRELLALAARHLRGHAAVIGDMLDSGDAQTQRDDLDAMAHLTRFATWLDGGARGRCEGPAYAAEALRERAEDTRRQVIDPDDPDPPVLDPKDEAAALDLVADWLDGK